jgi:hypothetical protein
MWSDLESVPAKHGDVAFCIETGQWHSWRDDGTWPADGGAGGSVEPFANLDGGDPSSTYGGINPIDAGAP